MKVSRTILLVQLPVPQLTPREITGNAGLAAADLVLHARASGARGLPELRVASPDAMRRVGDAALEDYVVALAPAVLACTCTVWNVERTLDLVRRVRRRLPDLGVWLGGPEIASDGLVAANRDAFDVAVEGEGEAAFLALAMQVGRPRLRQPRVAASRTVASGAQCLADRPDTAAVATAPTTGTGQRGRAGRAREPGKIVRGEVLADLSSVHDPYVSGLVAPEADRVALAELWRGCRYRCAFCRYHQGRQGPGAARPDRQVRDFFAWAAEAGVREVYLLDPSLEQRPDLASFLSLLSAANPHGAIPLFVELRAELLDQKTVAALARCGVRRVEAGLQTLTPEALRRSGRKLDRDRFVQGMRWLHAAGIDVKVDLMLGLPGDSEQGLLATLDFLRSEGFAGNLQVFRTQALPGTLLRTRCRRDGIPFQTTPPYHILETPDWPAERLHAATELVEERLGTDLSLIDAPVIEWPDPARRSASTTRYPGSAAAFQYSFNLDAAAGREALGSALFRDAGTAVCLLVQCADPFLHLDLVRRGVARLLSANPHAALTLVLEPACEFPLDVLDALDRDLSEGRRSLYLERLCGRPRPERRLLVLLEDRTGRSRDRGWDEGWVEAVRDAAGVMWRIGCGSGDEAVARLASPPDFRDYLLVVLPERLRDIDALAARLIDACPTSHNIVLSGLERHWRYVRCLEHGQGADW